MGWDGDDYTCRYYYYKALPQILESPIDEYISSEANHPNVKYPIYNKHYIYLICYYHETQLGETNLKEI